jgi:hypothetical protein
MNENEAISEVVQPTRRRRHSKEFKEKVIRAAMQPNVSIAAVALHYQLNANLLRRWVAAREEQDVAREARQSMSAPPAQFVGAQGIEVGGWVHPASLPEPNPRRKQAGLRPWGYYSTVIA